MTVGDLAAEFLLCCGVETAFGVISIHNMPILDAFGRRTAAATANGERPPIRFVPARSEQGAVNMADGYARVRGGLGVAVTSTGTAAGNACGAMVEALTAGTPVLHLTGQIPTPYLDRGLAYIHEAPAQLAMLGAVSKAAFRVEDAATALGTLREAVRVAFEVPQGPVSVEIPIDIQASAIAAPARLAPLENRPPVPAAGALDALAERLARARRPLLWLGGGARDAGSAVARLVELGFGVVTSVQGRGIVAEDHRASLGAFNLHPPVAAFYRSCDAMLVVGSRLRSNETLEYRVELPRPLYRIDADPRRQGQGYADDLFVVGDSALALAMLADRLAGRMRIDRGFAEDLRFARETAAAMLRRGLGPYSALAAAIQEAAGRDFVWVRDVTVANSTWGNRGLPVFGPRDGAHAVGGGIGKGVAMALGAALAAGGRKTLCLVGDGGLQLGLGELATLVQERAEVVVLLMNDRGYGVIRNIQDAQYGGRRHYADLHTADFRLLAQSLALPFARIRDPAAIGPAAAKALAQRGPMLIEIDMAAIGPFAEAFAGPPTQRVVG